MLNLDSSSSLNRYQTRLGAKQSQPDTAIVPEYIVRCRLKAEILANKVEIMDRLEKVAPVKWAAMHLEGFDTGVMTMGPHKYEKFILLVQQVGVIEAYVLHLTPLPRTERQLEAARAPRTKRFNQSLFSPIHK